MSKYQTRQRKELLAYLSAHADEPLTARHIARELGNSEISLSAVYRNLNELEKEGLLRRVAAQGAGREACYQYAADEHCREALHLDCRKCGRSFHMDGETADALIARVAERDGFQLDRTETVLYGVCGNCREVPR